MSEGKIFAYPFILISWTQAFCMSAVRVQTGGGRDFQKMTLRQLSSLEDFFRVFPSPNSVADTKEPAEMNPHPTS